MFMDAFIKMVIWAAILQGLFLGVLYFASKKHNSLSNKILGLFLFSLFAEAINAFGPFHQIWGYAPHEYFGLPETKLFFPALFLHYVLLKIGQSKKYRTFLRVCYSLGLIVAGFTLINFGLFINTGRALSGHLTQETIDITFMSQQTLAFFLCLAVLVISIKELKLYKRRVASAYSDIMLLNISWLWKLVISIGGVSVLWGLELLRIALGGLGGESAFVYMAWLALSVFLYYLSYMAFVQRDLFEEDLETGYQTVPDEEEQKPDNLIDFGRIKQTLEEAMDKERLYLQNDLTLYELARAVEIPTRKISQCINNLYSTNFSDWVNRYRVDEATKLLNSMSESNLTIEGIGFNSGFKSRSAMYLAFRKITGRTPGDFKQ